MKSGNSDQNDFLSLITQAFGIQPVAITAEMLEDGGFANFTTEDVKSEKDNSPRGFEINVTPEEMVAHLDKYVVGQDEVKKGLAVALYNHYKYVVNSTDDVQRKSNVLLCGPSGSGKTYIVETLAKLIGVPFAVCDATSLTQTGYVGDDVNSLAAALMKAANDNPKLAECGIIFLDEFDKLVSKESSFNRQDVGGRGVQQALLKMFEGCEVNIDTQTNIGGFGEKKTLNTKNVLFICAGAFVGLEEVIAKLKATNAKSPGASNKKIALEKSGEANNKVDLKSFSNILRSSNDDDITSLALINYGFLPEIVGRLPLIFNLKPLGLLDFERIVCGLETSVLKEYENRVAAYGYKLHVSAQFIKHLIILQMTGITGARGLRTLFERALCDFFYHAPSQNIKETGNHVLLATFEHSFLEPILTEYDRVRTLELKARAGEEQDEKESETKEKDKGGLNLAELSKQLAKLNKALIKQYEKFGYNKTDAKALADYFPRHLVTDIDLSMFGRFPDENYETIITLMENARSAQWVAYAQKQKQQREFDFSYDLTTTYGVPRTLEKQPEVELRFARLEDIEKQLNEVVQADSEEKSTSKTVKESRAKASKATKLEVQDETTDNPQVALEKSENFEDNASSQVNSKKVVKKVATKITNESNTKVSEVKKSSTIKTSKSSTKNSKKK